MRIRVRLHWFRLGLLLPGLRTRRLRCADRILSTGDGLSVSCHAPGACSTDGAECAFDDTDEDTYDDASFAAGAASVDITSDNPDCGWASGEYWDGSTCLTLDLVVDDDGDTLDDFAFRQGNCHMLRSGRVLGCSGLLLR